MTSEEIKGGIDIIKMANDWAKLIFEPSAKEFGLLLGDLISRKREIMKRNWEVTSGKIHTILIEESVIVKEISSKALIPIIEGVSLEDDENIQTMWANLFVNYVDVSKNLNVSVYPSILKQLSTNEVKILDYFKEPFYSNRLTTKFLHCDDLTFTEDEIHNLERLSLIEEEIELEYKMRDNRAGSVTTKVDRIAKGVHLLTDFGKDFVMACKR
jgi:hypothetical protein